MTERKHFLGPVLCRALKVIAFTRFFSRHSTAMYVRRVALEMRAATYVSLHVKFLLSLLDCKQDCNV